MTSYLNPANITNGEPIYKIIQALQRSVVFSRAQLGKSSHFKEYEFIYKNKDQTREIILNHLNQEGYCYFPFDDKWVIIKDCGSRYAEALIVLEFDASLFTMDVHGDYDEIQSIGTWLNETFECHRAISTIVYGKSERSGLLTSKSYVEEAPNNKALQSFYPWMTVLLSDYFKAFMESRESILVCYGPPGTGKSTFMRNFVLSGPYNFTLAYGKEVLESSSLVSHFITSSNKILICEDADTHVRSRDSGNQHMSTILNMSEGVVHNDNKKIIFSTNLPSINHIDPALLRRGRCFDILPFRELTPDEAAVACADAGISPKDWKTKSSWTLAEALASDVDELQTINRFAKRVGFI
jgi:hypothetical protein